MIASVAGTDLVLIVTEPTLSAMHDMDRAMELTRHFGIPTVICINKFDLNEEITGRIEEKAGNKIVGRVRYDPAFTKAQLMKATVVEYTGGQVAEDVKSLWRHLVYTLG